MSKLNNQRDLHAFYMQLLTGVMVKVAEDLGLLEKRRWTQADYRRYRRELDRQHLPVLPPLVLKWALNKWTLE